MASSKFAVVFISLFWSVSRFTKIAAVTNPNNSEVNPSQVPYPYDLFVKTASGVQIPTQRWDQKDPITVAVNIYLRALSHIDPINMEFRIQMTFRQEWLDKRLAYNQNNTIDQLPAFLVVPENMHDVIWKPDTFFQNEIETKLHNFDKPNRLIRIYPDGKVLMSTRLTTSFSCPMDWSYFPFDSQICSMDLASYAFTTEDLVYRWKSGSPIQTKHGLSRSLAEFHIQSVLANYCTSKTATGEYSCLRASLIFERSIGHHLIHFYIPCIAMVVTSSLVFWLDESTSRLMIGLSALLITSLMAADVNSGLPRISYLRAIDIWIAACLLFIMFSVVESVIVHYLSRKNMNECTSFENEMIKEASDQQNRNSPELQYAAASPVHFIKNSKQCKSSKRIDTISRLAFPVTFLIFSGFYFFAYVHRRAENNLIRE